jgi:Uma2 family endonuclease
MAQAIELASTPRRDAVPPLENGDCLDQATFHRRYLAMPEDFRAELINGIVYVSSPLKINHGRHHALVIGWIANYWAATPGTDLGDNPTVILADDGEPQPDAVLMIDPAHGGQATISEDNHVVGPPELVVEVASSSESYDMHQKRRDYEQAGMLEYVVVLLREQAVRWFTLENGAYRDLPPGDGGVYRSRVFPGLWLDAAALLQLNGRRVLEVLQQGLCDPSHAAFLDALPRRAIK